MTKQNPTYGVIDPDYARVFTIARCIAWSEGYALTMHGSFTRDLDLLAVPWTEQATEPEHLVRRIVSNLDDLDLLVKDPKAQSQATQKPHGRLAWTLTFKAFGDPRFVDLSVMPRSAASTLENGPAGLADAKNDPADSDLSSLREGDGTTYPRLSSLRKDAVGPAVSEGGRGHSAPVTSGAEVVVKPLEWDEHPGDQFCRTFWQAKGFGGHYVVEVRHTGDFDMWLPETSSGQRFATLDEAKSAAQSDFETRIRSALVSGSREEHRS